MSNKEPKQEMKKQETEASSNGLYNPLKDTPPSSPSNTHQVDHLNYVSGNNDDIFLARLRKHVGPNLEKLINPDETPQQAYERHMQIIGAASRLITNQEQLVKWLENPAHANYHFPKKGFNRVIKNVNDLRVAVDIPTKSAHRLIEYVLADEDGSVFARLFCDIEALQAFAANFAKKDVRRVIEEVFVNTDAFEGIFKDELALAKFKGNFPGYADQATNLFMLKRQTLNAIKYLRKRVEEGWGRRAPRVSPSSPDAGSGASSSNSIQTAVAERTLSAANDPTEKASKGQKQKLAVVIPASLFGKTALSGEVSPVIQNLPAANDSKPQEDSFDSVFSNTADGPAHVLQDFLDGNSHKNLNQTSRANREIYDVETTYKKLLQENIGPDPARLRNAGETCQAAYQRHLAIIRGLAPINTQEELADRLATHPDYYYFNRLVSENDFARLFLEDFDGLLNFCRDFPLHTDRILGHVLTDAAKVAFDWGISNTSYLQQIATAFPAYAERFLERVLSDAEYFAWVVRDKNDLNFLLEHFAPSFPDHAKRVEALFAAREEALQADAKHSVQPIHVSRTGPLSPTAPAADFEMFSSSASQAVITQRTLLTVNDAKGETKEGPRQSTAKTYPPSFNTNAKVSSSSVDQVTVTVQASSAVDEAKEEISGGQKPKLAVAIPASLFGKPRLLEGLSPVIQNPPAANEVSKHDLENQSEPPKKGKCCWIL
jgi:hypothetical protein